MGQGIPLRDFFARLGLPVHSMVVDGKPVDVDKVRVYGFTPAREDGTPDEARFVPVPEEALT